MLLKKLSPAVAIAFAGVLGLSACNSGSDVGVSDGDVEVSGTDSTEETCERFNDVNGRFNDIDLESMEPDEVAQHFSDGIAEIEAVSQDAEDVELGQSIATMADALRSALGSAEGDLETIHAQFEEQLQGIDVQDAAAHLDETCDARMNL